MLDGGPKVELSLGQRKPHAIVKTVACDAYCSDLERCARNIDRNHARGRKLARNRDGDATTTGSKIDGRLHVLRLEPRFESLTNQFGDR